MKSIVSFLLVMFVAITGVHAQNASMKLVAGSYTLGSFTVGSDPSTMIIYSAPSNSFKQLIKISNKGVVSGVWEKTVPPDFGDEDGFTYNNRSDVSLKGKILKVTKVGKDITASFTFTMADGAKGSGAVTVNSSKIGKKVSYSYSLKGKIRVAGLSGSFFGYR